MPVYGFEGCWLSNSSRYVCVLYIALEFTEEARELHLVLYLLRNQIRLIINFCFCLGFNSQALLASQSSSFQHTSVQLNNACILRISHRTNTLPRILDLRRPKQLSSQPRHCWCELSPLSRVSPPIPFPVQAFLRQTCSLSWHLRRHLYRHLHHSGLTRNPSPNVGLPRWHPRQSPP